MTRLRRDLFPSNRDQSKGHKAMGSPQHHPNDDEDEDEDENEAAPSSDYSSCDGSENERYGSANSFLDSASLCSVDSFRSFGSESFRSVDSSWDAKLEEAAVGGGFPRENGLYEDRLLRGRLDSLPRIRTRPFRGRPSAATVECSRKLLFSPEGSVASGRGWVGPLRSAGRSSECASSVRDDGDRIVNCAESGGNVECGSGDVLLSAGVPVGDGGGSGWGDGEIMRDRRGLSGGALQPTYLGPFDTSIGENGDGEEVVMVGLGVNGSLAGRLTGKNVVAEKAEAVGSNGCLSSSASTNREYSDFTDRNSASPICSTSYSSQQSVKIDRIEVAGTSQRKGDVSFGERLIGVKEYGVYKLKVWRGDSQWEIERRYHDFFLLYCQLKALYKDHGLHLPPPWSKVPHESRKIFGNASPPVIRERSILIQDCLQSILNAGAPLGTLSCLIWFVSPINAFCDPNASIDLLPESFLRLKNDAIWDPSTLGKMLSKIVEIKSHKSKKELLEEQGYTCAGCHRYINPKMSPVEELIQMLGWGKFQVCEFTGQLFCSSCHTNETAVLPPRVLHHWDFALYPVSNAAKSFLDSIYNQPILCIGAVNPFLFLKVSSLLNIIDLRKKIGAILPYIRCPFWRSIEIYFGSHKYLLEANDLFALRDLVDISKGAFAELPALLNNVLHKIHDHIMKQCPVCYELGIPCAAQNACRESSSLIFPLQEAGTIRCASCGLIYHGACFRYLAVCQCGKANSVNRIVGSLGPRDPGEEIELDGVVDSPTHNSYEQSSGYTSKLISKARPDFQWIPRNCSLVVTMNSLLDAFS